MDEGSAPGANGHDCTLCQGSGCINYEIGDIGVAISTTCVCGGRMATPPLCLRIAPHPLSTQKPVDLIDIFVDDATIPYLSCSGDLLWPCRNERGPDSLWAKVCMEGKTVTVALVLVEED